MPHPLLRLRVGRIMSAASNSISSQGNTDQHDAIHCPQLHTQARTLAHPQVLGGCKRSDRHPWAWRKQERHMPSQPASQPHHTNTHSQPAPCSTAAAWAGAWARASELMRRHCRRISNSCIYSFIVSAWATHLDQLFIHFSLALGALTWICMSRSLFVAPPSTRSRGMPSISASCRIASSTCSQAF